MPVGSTSGRLIPVTSKTIRNYIFDTTSWFTFLVLNRLLFSDDFIFGKFTLLNEKIVERCLKQGCRSRSEPGFLAKPEPKFSPGSDSGSGSYSYSYSYSTVL